LVLFDRFEQWACHEVRPTRHLALDFGPIGRVVALAHQEHIEFLKALVVLPDCFFFVDTLVALQSQYRDLISARDRCGQFRFAGAGRPFEHDGAMEPSSKVDGGGSFLIGEIAYAL
jgi:hypothetical protein